MPAVRGADSKKKTRRRRRDIDQVHADVHDPAHLSAYKDTKAVEDLPGLGRHYCVECSRWFEAEHNLLAHKKGKDHKRRCRVLKEAPYTQKDAESAVGLRTDNGRGEVEDILVDQHESENQVSDPAAALVPGSQREAATEAKKHDDNDEEEYEAFFTAY